MTALMKTPSVLVVTTAYKDDYCRFTLMRNVQKGLSYAFTAKMSSILSKNRYGLLCRVLN